MSASRLSPGMAFLALGLVPCLFAVNNIAARMAPAIVPPVALAFWRWAIASLVLLSLVGVRLVGKPVPAREIVQIAVLGFVGMALVSIATFWGARTTASANVGLIYAATPALIMALDRVWDSERLLATQLAGLVAGLAGMMCIIARGDPTNITGLHFGAGDLIVASGTLGWAFYSVLLKRWRSVLGTVERAALIALAGAIFAAPLALAEHVAVEPSRFSLAAVGIVATVGVLSGGLLIALHASVTAQLGPRRATVLLYLIPIYNMALGWAVLGERLQGYQFVGAAFILTGTWLISRAGAGANAPFSKGGKARPCASETPSGAEPK